MLEQIVKGIELLYFPLVLVGLVAVPLVALIVLVKRIRGGRSFWSSVREFISFLWRNLP